MKKTQTEAEFLAAYDPTAFKRPNCTVDLAIFTVLERELCVLLAKRDAHPFKDRWSLAGGFIDVAGDSDLEAAALRKLREKTGVAAPYLEQYGAVGNASRDPRGWSVTTVYFALIPAEGIKLAPGAGASEIRWAGIKGEGLAAPLDLAFDHAELLSGCLKRLRDKVVYTSLPLHLMPPSFTLGELQKVYELILGGSLEQKSFRRRMLGAGLLEETGEYRREAKRPALLYRPASGPGVHYFVRNLEGPRP